ncbi:MAG: hypothetical protein HYS05_14810 [Acidobacteria bacterium]|nr:hypothetical protein [Acidobacteriota bacterium]
MSDLFLGVIAAAVVVMAAIQVGAIVYMAQLARRVDQLTTKIEQEVSPLLANLTEVGQTAGRAAALALAQVERFDRLFADLSVRLQETMTMVQNAVVAPVREGAALIVAIKTVLAALRGLGPARRPGERVEDEDALFIG